MPHRGPGQSPRRSTWDVCFTCPACPSPSDKDREMAPTKPEALRSGRCTGLQAPSSLAVPSASASRCARSRLFQS